MADLPYATWLDFALKADYCHQRHHLLELFAGHAPMAQIAARLGVRSVALDHEKTMLLQGAGNRVCASALAIPFAAASFTVAVSTNASINHLSGLPDLAAHLSEIRRIVAPAGVYVFDCCTPGRAETLHLKTMKSSSGEIKFSHAYDRIENLLETRVRVKNKGVEIHRQRIFTDAELRHTIVASGFVVESVKTAYGLPVTPGSEPIMAWVLRRP